MPEARVIPPRLIGSLTERARAAVDRTAHAVAAVGEKLSPPPPAPGLRAVRDA